MKFIKQLVLAVVSFALVISLSQIATAAENLELLASQLKYQTGQITLQGGLATVKIPAELRYLDAAQTETVLEKLWGNPSGEGTLGMLVPKGFNPLVKNAWAVIITYEEDGYVKDDDAEKIDYAELLKTMQEATQAANEKRVKEGYPRIELVGWAKPPYYDKATKKLYWAKDLKFSDSSDHTLNYNIRVLGRKGVLVLNAVAGTDQLHLIEKATPHILSSVEFNPGNRYEDFNSSTDQIASYGIAALIAGGVAAKTGLLKGILLMLLAAKKFVIVAFLSIIGFISKLFGIKSKAQPENAQKDTPNQ
ncbi:MAG: DUF2167 domain-containing protein [Scytolyngbya sp. HA4215-MV1]|jgi:uncharacterized membrane-anchored protein|nr:DUF2167 domain-containing protein [Scytolyngbya sp. HA4215-MV1]